MAAIDLSTLLGLVGPLRDSTEPTSASSRFREYLEKNVRKAAGVREYIQAALSNKGENYSFAFQDLVNHVGSLVGFGIQFGRYRGISGQPGFDGLWRSPSGRSVVVEVKTTDVYTVSTDKLLGYINSLVSAGEIKDRFGTLGLYVYGRFDAQTSQLEKAIRAERREQDLRVVSVDALLGLLDLSQEYELDHGSILQILFPSDIRIDPVVDLILEIVAEEKKDVLEAGQALQQKPIPPPEPSEGKAQYYLLPAAEAEDGTPVIPHLHRWLDKGLWGLGERTRYRRYFKSGDRVCFYAKAIGVVAKAVVSVSTFELDGKESPVGYDVPYGVRLTEVEWFDNNPIQITADTRARLSTFAGREPDKAWSWFVQTTSKISGRDFEILTGKA